MGDFLLTDVNVVCHPVVMYHGSHRHLWGLFVLTGEVGSRLLPLNGERSLSCYRPDSVTETSLFYFPETNEVKGFFPYADEVGGS